MRQILAYLYIIIVVASAYADDYRGSLSKPKAIAGADIVDQSGQYLPGDVALIDHNGDDITIDKYFQKSSSKVPVIITLGYYKCPMLCSLVLNGMLDSLNKGGLKLGKDFRILSFTIDSREDYLLAGKKRKSYLKGLKNIYDEESWIFHVGKQSEIDRLSKSLGFSYYFDKKSDQYAHGAAIFIVSPDGKISKTFYGISFAVDDIKWALLDASQSKLGSIAHKILLSCFSYDPENNKYTIYAMGAMRLGGTATIAFLLLFLVRYWRKTKSVITK